MTRSGQRTRLRRARREAAVDRVRQRRRAVSCCLSFSSCLSLSLCLCVCVYIQASLPDCDQLSFCSALIARRFVPLFWRAFLRALRRGFRVSIVRWPGQRVGDRLRVSRPGSWPPLRTRTPLPFPPPPLSSALSSSPEPQRPIFVNAMASLCSLTLSLSLAPVVASGRWMAHADRVTAQDVHGAGNVLAGLLSVRGTFRARRIKHRARDWTVVCLSVQGLSVQGLNCR